MMIVKFTNRRLFVFLIALLSIWSSKLKAQFTITESFKGSAPQSAIVFGDAAFLTSSNGTDPVNQGWLRLTGSSGSSKGYAYVNKSFPSSLGTLIEFDYKSWRSTSDGLGGADGFTVFLFDANVSSFSLGAYGGSLGYASNTGTNGLSGGYLGIAIDEFGNFATAQEGRGTGINALDPSINQGPYPGSYPYIRPNSISVRGLQNPIAPRLILTSQG
ncbi:hypothetical protein MKQ70_13570 [Chitinophaga sedimenti]|uniref:hypothetical protein n=1 Tax=Chitinophaga sedimenti TaxID=2033606 RepID=UPI0020056E3D|nr:hypothetical protein [Chitinophaga sedimenti]MCK7555995.1 hypothetical protein [Chitinophaga sedimenti]